MDQPDANETDDENSWVLPSRNNINMRDYFKQIDEEGLEEELTAEKLIITELTKCDSSHADPKHLHIVVI